MNNMEQMKALIAQLETLEQAEIAEQLQALKQKVAELEAKAIAEVQEIAQEVVAEIPVGFWEKYRTEFIVAVLLLVSHAAGRLGN